MNPAGRSGSLFVARFARCEIPLGAIMLSSGRYANWRKDGPSRQRRPVMMAQAGIHVLPGLPNTKGAVGDPAAAMTGLHRRWVIVSASWYWRSVRHHPPTERTVLKFTDNPPNRSRTVLFSLSTPVAVPTTLNGTAVALPALSAPITASL